MADEVAINGGDRTLEISGNEVVMGSKLMQKVEALQQEKDELVRDNEAVRERISKLEGDCKVLRGEKAELEREMVRSDAEMKSLESVAARAAELEIEVSRLQHDLITAEVDGAEANKEVIELRREVEKLKESGVEKGQKLDVLEKERALLLKKIEEAENELRNGNEVGEVRVRELKKELEGLVGRENGEKAKIVEKDSEIWELKKTVENLELVIARNTEVMEKMKKEKEELEGSKCGLQGLLEKSEERVKEMEEKLGQLVKDLEVSERVISGLKEKTLDRINGIHVVEDEKSMYGVKLQWPVLATSAGVIIMVGAVWYLRMKQR